MRIDGQSRWGRGADGVCRGVPDHQRDSVPASPPPPRGSLSNMRKARFRTQIRSFFGAVGEVAHG